MKKLFLNVAYATWIGTSVLGLGFVIAGHMLGSMHLLNIGLILDIIAGFYVSLLVIVGFFLSIILDSIDKARKRKLIMEMRQFRVNLDALKNEVDRLQRGAA